MALRKGLKGGVANGAVAGAAAEIAAELIVELIVGVEIVPIVAFEERENEPGRAIAALRAVAFDHLLLDRMELTIRGDAFDADNFAASHQAKRHQATIDGAIAGLCARVAVDDSD